LPICCASRSQVSGNNLHYDAKVVRSQYEQLIRINFLLDVDVDVGSIGSDFDPLNSGQIRMAVLELHEVNIVDSNLSRKSKF
jgi:hypothetical protein